MAVMPDGMLLAPEMLRDALADLEAQGRAGRLQRKAARRAPEARAKKNRGRAQKRRGLAAEHLVAAALADCGFYRVPLSGRLGGRFAGDVRRDGDPERPAMVLEVKRRQGADRILRAQLAQGGADALVRVPGNGDAPLVVVTLETFRRMLIEAGYVEAGYEEGKR